MTDTQAPDTQAPDVRTVNLADFRETIKVNQQTARAAENNARRSQSYASAKFYKGVVYGLGVALSLLEKETTPTT